MSYDGCNQQWFCVSMQGDGGLLPLGECVDFDHADEIATDLGEPMTWLVTPENAQQWANVLASHGIYPNLEDKANELR